MKIAWFTPFSKWSAIGRFSRLVTEELARSHDVDIWHPATREPQSARLRTIALAAGVRVDARMLATYDLAVYNLGDHLDAHRDIWLASQAAPGIAILHDFVMHHFFAAWYLQERNSRTDYLAAMVRWYGEAGRAAAERSFSAGERPVWESADVMEYPLFEEALRRAHAVIVHCDFLRRRVEERCGGPVRKLWLPYNCPDAGERSTRRQLGVPDGRVLVVTVGQVNPNKRIPSVLETLGRNPDLRERVFYAVLGVCDDACREALHALAREHGLEDVIRITGRLPEDSLRAWLAHADLFVNLRCPAMEGGSASLAEEMLAGKPVIVSDAGVYSELPDDCVTKIRPDRELEDLAAALRRFVNDASARKAMGTRAGQFAQQEFRADKYAAGFLELAGEVLQAKPLLDVADRMADRMAQMGIPPDAGIIRRVAEDCYSLFCTRKETT